MIFHRTNIVEIKQFLIVENHFSRLWFNNFGSAKTRFHSENIFHESRVCIAVTKIKKNIHEEIGLEYSMYAYLRAAASNRQK